MVFTNSLIMKNYRNFLSVLSKLFLLVSIPATLFLISSCENDKKEKNSKTTITETNNDNRKDLEITDEIIAQEKAWASALVANDLNTLDSMMHKNFSLKRVYGEDPSISKEMYLGMKGMSASSAEVTSVKMIEKMGPLAVVRTTWSMDWQQEGVGKLPPHFDMIDTWVKSKNNKWLILSRVSQIADKPYKDKKETK